MRIRPLILLGLCVTVVASCSRAEPRPGLTPTLTRGGVATCDDPRRPATRITDTSVGPITIGQAIAGLRVACPALRDTTLVERAFDWVDTVRAFVAPLAGGLVLLFDEEGEGISAISIETPAFRTTDSLGVGDSIVKLRRLSGASVQFNDHYPTIPLTAPRHCGLVFYLSGSGSTPERRDGYEVATAEHLRTWPDSIRVVSITVAGSRACRDRHRR